MRGSSVSGYGGHFSGGKAQVRLVPASTAGKPTMGSHQKGELYMDSAATLWVWHRERHTRHLEARGDVVEARQSTRPSGIPAAPIAIT